MAGAHWLAQRRRVCADWYDLTRSCQQDLRRVAFLAGVWPSGFESTCPRQQRCASNMFFGNPRSLRTTHPDQGDSRKHGSDPAAVQCDVIISMPTVQSQASGLVLSQGAERVACARLSFKSATALRCLADALHRRWHGCGAYIGGAGTRLNLDWFAQPCMVLRVAALL